MVHDWVLGRKAQIQGGGTTQTEACAPTSKQSSPNLTQIAYGCLYKRPPEEQEYVEKFPHTYMSGHNPPLPDGSRHSSMLPALGFLLPVVGGKGCSFIGLG